MKNTLLGLTLVAVTVGAQVARADDWNRDGVDDAYQYGQNDQYGQYQYDQYNHGAVPVQQGARSCGPRPTYAPAGQTFNTGRYELQNVQRWVPGQQTQVWVPGQCSTRRHGRGGGWHHQRCTQGYYQSVWTPGRYETRQEWVWVSVGNPPPRPYYGTAGIKVQNGSGSFSVSVY